jgi:hypothetical protein
VEEGGAALAGRRRLEQLEQLRVVREDDRLVGPGGDVAVIGGDEQEEVAQAGRAREPGAQVAVEVGQGCRVEARVRAVVVGDLVDAGPVGLDHRPPPAVAFREQPGQDGEEVGQAFVAGQRRAIVEHAAERRADVLGRDDRPGGHAGAREAVVDGLEAQEGDRVLAAVGRVGVRALAVAWPPADRLAPPAQLGQVERPAEQPVPGRRQAGRQRDQRRHGGRREHRGEQGEGVVRLVRAAGLVEAGERVERAPRDRLLELLGPEAVEEEHDDRADASHEVRPAPGEGEGRQQASGRRADQLQDGRRQVRQARPGVARLHPAVEIGRSLGHRAWFPRAIA